MSIKDHGFLYWTLIGISVILAASPFLSRILIYPRVEFFTELWILDANHRAENYPYDITSGKNYTIHLSIANRLGYCAHYIIQVKFRNQSQPAPTTFGLIEKRSPSSLPSLLNISVFVADEQVLEIPITFSFDYIWDERSSQVKLLGLSFNDVWLNMSSYLISWDSKRETFQGFLFFELWLYDATTDKFQYHGRFVGLWLNMIFPQNLWATYKDLGDFS